MSNLPSWFHANGVIASTSTAIAEIYVRMQTLVAALATNPSTDEISLLKLEASAIMKKLEENLAPKAREELN